MYTFEKLTNAISALEINMKSIPSFIAVKVKPPSPAYSYYTDGEAAGTIAAIQLEIKITDPKSFEVTVSYNDLYLFPNGRLLTHFMNDKISSDVKTSCIGIVKQWLASIA